MLIRNIWCWTLDSKVEVSTSIYGGIGTPLVTQQLTWWFKVHLSRKAYVSRAMLISKLECWWTKFNVELSLIKLKSKVLTIALRTTKLNCKVECWSLSSQMLHSQVECCDLLWFLAGMELQTSEHRDQCEHVWNDLMKSLSLRFPTWSPSCVALRSKYSETCFKWTPY